MPSKQKEDLLQRLLDQAVDGKKIFGCSFGYVIVDDRWVGSAGNIGLDQPYFIASTTKLFTTAIIQQLRSQGLLKLDDRIDRFLDVSILEGLHVYKGKDYARQLTIAELLAHTSGLPDYFQDKNSTGSSLMESLLSGDDQAWTFEDALNKAKKLTPHFAPSSRGKAFYSDLNFQLLGKIIEVISGESFSTVCRRKICEPLGLSATYLYTDPLDNRPMPLYYKDHVLSIPQAMRSFGPDGGMVSTTSDMLTFLEAFFTGKLFPVEYLNSMKKWNSIFFPMKSGVGIHLFSLPFLMNPFGLVPDFIGHSGLSGALAFYDPGKKIFIAGTVNQVARPDLSFRTMIRLYQTIVKKV
jgi:D-alanyl-D-alanine carboxypeptidase